MERYSCYGYSMMKFSLGFEMVGKLFLFVYFVEAIQLSKPTEIWKRFKDSVFVKLVSFEVHTISDKNYGKNCYLNNFFSPPFPC